ncbi:transposase [Leptotrichia shahii]|uniref:transposase n=1 Tax=Leptotrichia shahii TaxID=157691 RepID=UPI0028D02083|nr:transposase [Leptotrichia shahii]
MKKSKFTQEFKEDTVKYYQSSGKSLREVADEMGIEKSTLDAWISREKKNDGKIEMPGAGNYALDKYKSVIK